MAGKQAKTISTDHIGDLLFFAEQSSVSASQPADRAALSEGRSSAATQAESLRSGRFLRLSSERSFGERVGARFSYVGVPSSPRNQPFTVSDCMGSASAATAWRSAGQTSPSRSASSCAGTVEIKVLGTWDAAITITGFTGGAQNYQSPVDNLGQAAMPHRQRRINAVSVPYCSLFASRRKIFSLHLIARNLRFLMQNDIQ